MKHNKFMDSTCLLMHKDVPCILFSFDNMMLWAQVNEVLSIAHLPPYMIDNFRGYEYNLNKFLDHRVIPKERPNISAIKDYFDSDSSLELSLRSYMLSVSDHYWIKPADSKVTWADVNFYDNSFEDDSIFISSLTTLKKQIGDRTLISFHSHTPNTSNNGTLPQMWLHTDESPVLYKTGNQPFMQEPFNEAVVSDLLDVLGFNHVLYRLGTFGGSVVSACDAFTTASIEFIPAWQLEKSRTNHLNGLDNYLEFLRQNGCAVTDEIRKQLEEMIIIDYLTMNDDRHWGNFGILRNSETLEFIGLAPIFDNGRTFAYNSFCGDYEAQPAPYNLSKAFAENGTHDRELTYVTGVHDIDYAALKAAVPDIFEKRLIEVMARFEAVDTSREVVVVLERKVPGLIQTLLGRIDAMAKELG